MYRIVILTRGLLFEFQMRKHITCMDTEWISFCSLSRECKNITTIADTSHTCSFLNSLCNSDNKPLVYCFVTKIEASYTGMALTYNVYFTSTMSPLRQKSLRNTRILKLLQLLQSYNSTKRGRYYRSLEPK